MDKMDGWMDRLMVDCTVHALTRPFRVRTRTHEPQADGLAKDILFKRSAARRSHDVRGSLEARCVWMDGHVAGIELICLRSDRLIDPVESEQVPGAQLADDADNQEQGVQEAEEAGQGREDVWEARGQVQQ